MRSSLLLALAVCLCPSAVFAQGADTPERPELCPPDYVGCHTGDLDWFYRDAFFDDVDFDTGWVPSGSPLQLRFQFFLGGSTEVEMGGTAVTSWPAPLNLQVPGRPETGRFSVNYGMEIHVFLRFDVRVAGIRYTFEQELPVPFIPSDLRLADEVVFDPMVLPGADPRPIMVADTTGRIELFTVGLGSFIPIPGVDGGLAVDVTGGLEGFYGSDRLVISDARGIDVELGETVVGPDEGVLGFGAAKDMLIHPEGTLDYTGILTFFPTLFIDVGSRFDFTLAEIPVDILDLTSNVVFDDAMNHVPLPDVEIMPTMIDLGEVMVGDESEQLLRIRNAGEATLNITVRDPASPFSLGGLELSVPPSSTGTLAVRFAPESASAAAAMLFIATNDPDESLVLVRLGGLGTEPPPPPPPMMDAGMPDTSMPMVDSGRDAGATTAGGCGCAVPGARTSRTSSNHAAAVLLLLAVVALTRRSRRG